LSFRAVRALVALAGSLYAPLAVADLPPEPVNRVTSFALADLLAVRSFYQRHVHDDVHSDDVIQQQLWGITADSRLPLTHTRAQLEYALWLPDGEGHAAVGDDRNRLIRLRLNDRWRTFDYGARLFSVGDAFVQNPIARTRVDAAGLPGAGDGAEIWLGGRLPSLGLEPRFRRLEKSHGDFNLVNETMSLAFGHGLGELGRLHYLLESTASTTWFDHGGGHQRDSTMATLRLDNPRWNLFVKNGIFAEAPAGSPHHAGELWEAGATLSVFEGLRLTPVISGQTRDQDAGALRQSRARLVLDTSWIDPVAVNLLVQRDRRENPNGSNFQGTSADLNLRAPLRAFERLRARMTMTATLGYRGMQGLAHAAPEEGMSLRLTLDFTPRI
jgi:hypothetical protein